MPRVLALAASLALLAGCSGGELLRTIGVEPPALRIEGATPQALDAEGVTIGLQGRLENPNPIALSVARFSYEVALQGTRVGTGELPSKLSVPARGAAPVTFPVRVRWADLPNLLGLITTRESLALRISGKVGVSSSRWFDLPYDVETKVPLPKLPRIELRGAAVRESSLLSTLVGVQLAVRNPNAFPLPAGKLDYDLSLAGVPIARAAAAALQGVPSRGESLVEIPVRFSPAGAIAGALTAGARRSTEVALTGKAGYGALEVGIDGRTPLAR